MSLWGVKGNINGVGPCPRAGQGLQEMDIDLISGKERGTRKIYGGEEFSRSSTSPPESKKGTQGGRVANIISY